MKKAFSIIIVLSLLILTGCGSSTQSSGAPNSVSPSSESKASDSAAGTPDIATDETVYTVKFAYVPAEQTPEACADTAWAYATKDYVESKSNGRLKLEYYPGGQLGGHSEYVTSASEASVETAIINISVLNSYSANIMALLIPGLYTDEVEATGILNSNYAKQIFSKVEQEQNITLAGIFCNGFRSFTTKGIQLHSVEDIKGHTFRVMDDPMYVAMVEALGAIPAPMAATEMYTAMQNGVVDGHENTIANVLGDLTYEVQDYMVLDKHTASVAVGIVSTKFLVTLPEDLQKILLEGMQVGADAANETVEKLNTEGVQKLREKGMTIYEPTEEELSGWQTAVLTSTEAYVRGRIGDEVVDGVKKEIENYRSA